MKEEKPIIISDWTKGQAESNLMGFQTMKCVEVFDTPGVVKIANRSLAQLTVAPTALPVFHVRDTLGNYYYGLSSGKVYKNDGTLLKDTSDTVYDGVVYKNYLIVTHGTYVSSYGPLDSGSAAWYTKWKPLCSITYGATSSQFDITNPSGSTFRYTWDGTGTDPGITAAKFVVGDAVVIIGTAFTAANTGRFTITGSGTNYFEITNASGVAENDKTLIGGYLGIGQTTGHYLKLQIGQDDTVYVANGNNIATITSFTKATAGTAPTATLTNVALDLPEQTYVVTMAELGKYLMIGTTSAPTWATRNNYKKAAIYLWDRVSTSFNLPIQINENSIQQMFSDNNKLYVTAGIKGNLYVTDSTNYTLLKKIPWNADRPSGAFCQMYPNAIAMNNNGNLLIGTSTYTDSYTGGDNASKHGIYEIDLKSGNYAVVLKTIPNNGDTGASVALTIGCINPGSDDTTVFGWSSGTSYGLDTTDSKMYTSYTAVIESQLYQVGTRLNRHVPYQNLEFTLQKGLVSGQAIRISYRQNASTSYTVLGTFDYATLGGVISHNTKCPIDDAENLQFKIELTQPTTATAGQNINLMNVKVW
jgi:hypothetical protein